MATTRIMAAEDGRAIDLAAELLRQGQLVAFPTETVYGLGADARSDEAVGRIYEAKGRPGTNPIIVHVADIEAAEQCVREFPERAARLAEEFWPGPLTLILPRAAAICARVSAGLDTVAIRCPRHAVAQELLEVFDGPIAAPSANRSGFTSPTTARHVWAELNGRVPLILDGGVAASCEIGVESTVLDAMANPPVILRPGGVTREMIEAVVGRVGEFPGYKVERMAAASPGMLSRHYAPRTTAYRAARGDWACVLAWANARRADGPAKLVWVTHDPALVLEAPHETVLMPGQAAAYARELYAALRAADDAGASSIVVLMPDSEEGMWAAVADRLRRATLPLPVL